VSGLGRVAKKTADAAGAQGRWGGGVFGELLINTAVAEGITSLATVHDSFGCLPSRAERFRRIIREQFLRLYEKNDVLAQVLDVLVKTWVNTLRTCLTRHRLKAPWTLSKC
jgi:hypothetical protein